MKDLSIVIRASEDKIYDYINVLEPVLLNSKYELIILNNTINKLDIKYDYTLYKFHESQDMFKEFCFSSSRGNKVMVLDGNIQLNSEIVNEIILNLLTSEFGNIAYSFRRFLTPDKSLYYLDSQVLVYSRGLKGFNIEGQKVIDDFTLIDEVYKEININKFIRCKQFSELYLWYKHYIFKCLPEFEQEFFEILESAKIELNEEDAENIEKLFIEGSDNPKYCEFLFLKKELKSESFSDSEGFSDRIFSLAALSTDKYNAWLIYQIIKDRKKLPGVIYKLNSNLLKTFIEYLSNYSNFHEFLYDFIMEVNCPSNTCDKNIKFSKTNLMLMKVYIAMASESSAEPALKNKLLKVFELYINAGMKILTEEKNPAFQSEEPSDRVFMIKFQDAIDSIKHKDIDKAVFKLKELCTEYPSFNMVLRYYIKRLRFVNNSYPFVISICMIVRDEEKNLNRCLTSLKPMLSSMAELIIVDTGSTDRTVEIAKTYTKNVFFYKWQGSFSDARNYSISLAEGEYIFVIDADEEFEGEEIKKILDEFSTISIKEYNTCTLKIKNYTDILQKEYAVLTQPRIFKNNCEFYYSGKVHNQPAYKAPTKHMTATVTHYGYIMTKDIKDKKFQRTANMLKSELQKNPQNIYYRFQLSTSYAMHCDLKEALEQAEIYMRRIREENIFSEDYLMHYNNAALLYISSHQYEEASAICDDALKISPNFIDFIYYKALIYSETGEDVNALEYTNKYLELIDNFMSSSIANDGRYSFYSLGLKNDVIKRQILCNYRLGNYNGIVNTLNSFNSEIYKDCLHAIVYSYIKTQRYAELSQFYKTCCSDTKTKLIFRYFVEDYAQKSDDKIQIICQSMMDSLSCPNQALLVIENYDIDSLNLTEARGLFNKLLPAYSSLQIDKEVDINEIYGYKRLAQFILHRSSLLSRFRDYSTEKLINILRKYMALASTLIINKKADLLEAREQQFLVKMTEAFKQLGMGNHENTVKLLKESIELYRDMEGLIKLILKSVIPGYKPENYATKSVIIEDNSEEIGSYAAVVKKKLIEAANNNSFKEMLEIFRQFDSRELYDPELFSYKAVLLMSEELYYEAMKELEEGLKRYPNDIRLLSSLCRLYSLTQDYNKSLETFCRVKILSQNKCLLKPGELFPCQSNDNTSEKPRVLLGAMFADNTINRIASELSRKNIYVKTLNYCPKYTGYNSDYVINMNQYESGSEIVSRAADAASRLIPEFDIFHFHYGSSLTFDYSDLPLLKELGKKVIVHFWGDEVKINGKVTKEKLQIMSGYAACCIVPDDETYECVKEFFEKVYVIKKDEIDKLVDLYKSLK